LLKLKAWIGLAGSAGLAFASLAALAADKAAPTVPAAPAQVESPMPLGPIARPRWLRYPAISPDGQQIAFAFEGSLFVVPVTGGPARVLVDDGHRSFAPVWSPDGKRIAYASDAHGNFDVYVIDAQGGNTRRLTTHSSNEVPVGFTPDGKEVLFSAHRMDARTNVLFPSPAAGELYAVSIDGGRRPRQVLTTPALAAQYNHDGSQMLYEDWKGYENLWRKHHVSPVAHDIWLFDPRTREHKRLTTFEGEDRNPVWSPDEKSVVYLSERDGTFNIWQMPLAQPDAATQVTHFTRNPVRFLTVAHNGTMAFSQDGELYTLAPGATEPQRLQITISANLRAPAVQHLVMTDKATEIAASPDGKEVAFVARGEVFVASTEFGDTRRITDTPSQERSVSFSPDGRHLVFAGERDGHWNLYEASLPGSKKDNPYFFNAGSVKIRTLLANGQENFQPRWSPDGKRVAYLENRTTIKVLDVASGKAHVVLPSQWNYSYQDGDQWFDWSPDGRSLLVQFADTQRWSNEVGLIDADGKGPLHNLTLSGWEDTQPRFVRDGKAMIWFSDRAGLHGTSGEGQFDVYEMFFTRAERDRFQLSKSEYALLKKTEEDAEKEKQKAKEKAEEKAKEQAKDKHKADAADEPVTLPDPVTVDFDHIEDRTTRLTPNSGELVAAALTPDGEALYTLQRTSEGLELWRNRMREHELKKFTTIPAPDREQPADLVLDAKGDRIFILAAGQIQSFELPKDEAEPKLKPVTYSAEMTLDPAAERAYLFEHAWRQTKDKLYTEDMNGVDWNYYLDTYAKFLPFINNNWDFAECLSEMLGELNVSHTGSGYRPPKEGADETAALGAFFDPAWTGAGIKVAEVLEGGPLDADDVRVRPGMVIEKIGGSEIAPGAEYDSLLNHQVGKRLALTVLDPATGKRFEQVVKPIALTAENELLYQRWVRMERAMVDKLSGGKIGYVHVRAMNDHSYRDAVAEILGRDSGKLAEVVDTRFNGGGNLHDELATLLSGTRYLEFLPRGQSLGWEPVAKWTKPTDVLISESNYSDAHLFPWVYQHLHIGKLVGMPIAGTGTAVWWETQQDPTLYFGIPQVGFRDAQGHFMEKTDVQPDIRVRNDPEAEARGDDQQLEAAVKALLQR
jgi:Tol biopolymer transport system component/C-terminal processing protease CtpA/Prc